MKKNLTLINYNLLNDRDYLLTKDNIFYKLIADNELNDNILGYVKYFLDKSGSKKFEGESYSKNNFLCNSLSLAPNHKSYSLKYDANVTSVSSNNIYKIFKTNEELLSLIESPKLSLSAPGLVLIKIFYNVLRNTSLKKEDLGITGSFLVGINNHLSDVDFVLINQDKYKELHEYLEAQKWILSYLKNDNLKKVLVKRRAYLDPSHLNIRSIILQEKNKIQGLIDGVHFNFQLIRRLNVDSYFLKNKRLKKICFAVLKLKIICNREGFFSPSIYKVECLKVFSLFPKSNIEKSNIQFLLSITGTYASCYEVGSIIIAKGILSQVVTSDQLLYGLEVETWEYNLKDFFGIHLLANEE